MSWSSLGISHINMQGSGIQQTFPSYMTSSPSITVVLVVLDMLREKQTSKSVFSVHL